MAENTNKNKDELFVLAKKDSHSIEDVQGSSLSYWKDARIRFMKNKASVISVVVVIIVFIIALIGPLLGAYHLNDSEEAGLNYIGSYTNVDYKYLPPRIPGLEKIGIFDGVEDGVNLYEEAGAEDYYFIFGTDNLGRDLFVRVSVGTLISIAFGMTAAFIDILVGVTLGGMSGYFGGKFDLFMQRVVEVLGTVPTLIWVMVFVIYFGAGFLPLVFSLVISGWIPMFRIVRGQVMKIKEQEFVLSSQTLGGSGFYIILHHIMPNIISAIIIWLMFTIPSAIFTESFLSYIGLGIQLPIPSLGSLVSDAKSEVEAHTYLIVAPTLVLSTIMLTFNLVADGLRDAFDPKMRGGE